MSRATAVRRLVKGVYDLIAGSVLLAVLVLASCAGGLWLLTDLFAARAGVGGQEFLMLKSARALGVEPVLLRLILFAVADVLVIAGLWRPIRAAGRLAGRAWDRGQQLVEEHAVLGLIVGAPFTMAITLGLVAFVLQPTLVPLSMSKSAWTERAANLVDGTATVRLGSSIIGLVRRFTAKPVAGQAQMDPGDYLSGDGRMMDRWDPVIAQVAEDPELAAMTKAFMYVESAGRQYAVSPTGCSGLMQFCVSTAQRRPFREIFGVGQVAACGCTGCAVPKDVAQALETDPGAPSRVGERFPCDLADARFDGEKSIRAGTAYVDELRGKFGGNVPLMYVGYNSGPAVASRIWKRLGEDPDATLEMVGDELEPALAPYYGDSASGRAASLMSSTLPKLVAAHERYRPE